MMRIVFDTNIVVSAMISPSGTAAAALRLALSLVTGNIRHFPAAWGRTRVITARQLVELVTPKP